MSVGNKLRALAMLAMFTGAGIGLQVLWAAAILSTATVIFGVWLEGDLDSEN